MLCDLEERRQVHNEPNRRTVSWNFLEVGLNCLKAQLIFEKKVEVTVDWSYV